MTSVTTDYQRPRRPTVRSFTLTAIPLSHFILGLTFGESGSVSTSGSGRVHVPDVLYPVSEKNWFLTIGAVRMTVTTWEYAHGSVAR